MVALKIKMFNRTFSAILHILKYMLNVFINSVVGKSKQLFPPKMLQSKILCIFTCISESQHSSHRILLIDF